MILKSVSAVAVCSLFCAQIVQAKSPAFHSFPSDSAHQTSLERHIIRQLEAITDSISFLDTEIASKHSANNFVPFTIEGRLSYLQKEVPLTYNSQVQSYIDTYSGSRYKNYICRMMGLGEYYFPIFERVFAETGLPDEIKYLAVVESALNPHAVSRVGATGPWQFMFATAKMYNLAMDNYVDERKDPVAASYAASAYLKDAYNEFGDWLLAIAAYNCGKGNVLRAIRRSGLSQPDFWAISPYLPRETRNYVPAFIAMTYMFGFHKEYDITPLASQFAFETEEVAVNQFIPLSGVAQALEVDLEVIKVLNPAYKRDVVNGSKEAPRRLILPTVDPSFYPAVYAALNDQITGPVPLINASNSDAPRTTVSTTHRVKKGESLGKIAQKYRVTVQDLRAWNNLKGTTIVPGQRLRVLDGQATPSKTSNNNASYITYTVKKGDTLSTIAQRHRGATVTKIKAENGLKNNQIKPGMELRIGTL